MSLTNRLALLKKFIGVVGIVSASTLMSLPAWAGVQTLLAQSSSENQSSPGKIPAEVEEYLNSMSEEEMKSFCSRYPMNSRCTGRASQPGAAPSGGTTPGGTMESPSTSPSSGPDRMTEPGGMPSEGTTPGSRMESPSTSPRPGSDRMTEPGGLPSTSPSPGSGSMTEPEGMPSEDTSPEGTMEPPSTMPGTTTPSDGAR